MVYRVSESNQVADVYSIIPPVYKTFCKKENEWFSKSDGSDDLTQWERAKSETDLPSSRSVGIECDVLLLDWKRLALIQWKNYNCLFSVIVINPPWDVKLSLPYPVLN